MARTARGSRTKPAHSSTASAANESVALLEQQIDRLRRTLHTQMGELEQLRDEVVVLRKRDATASRRAAARPIVSDGEMYFLQRRR